MSIAYRQYRAPKAAGEAFVDPTWSAIGELIAKNQQRIAGYNTALLGKPLAELAKAARRRMLSLASLSATDNQTVIVSGHQPELFHPGVWFKNFALDRLAKQSDGIGIHLRIDSDLCREVSLRVPTGKVAAPRIETIAYDRPAEPMPYEERAIVDGELFQTFARRVQETLKGLVDQPLVTQLWPAAMNSQRHNNNLGDALSDARHAIEQSWGSTTHELSLSQLCDQPEFRWAMLFLLTEAARVREAYNAALAEYRTAHRLRNNAQPLPNLSTNEGWIETPLWVWTTQKPTRQPLFVKANGETLCLSNHAGLEWQISAKPKTGDADLAELRQTGVKIRPRALITTLLARLLLGDLFLHGIGGAKYDQVTDELSRQLFGFAPPSYATLSATFRLPIEHPPATDEHARQLQQRLRELTYHPEKFIESEAAAELIAQKRAAIVKPKTPENAARRHQQIVSANEALRAHVSDQLQATEQQQTQLSKQLRAAVVLESREYSLALFPEKTLRYKMEAIFDRQPQ